MVAGLMQAEWDAASSDGDPGSPRAGGQEGQPALEQCSQLLRWPTPAPETPPLSSAAASQSITAAHPQEPAIAPGAWPFPDLLDINIRVFPLNLPATWPAAHISSRAVVFCVLQL